MITKTFEIQCSASGAWSKWQSKISQDSAQAKELNAVNISALSVQQTSSKLENNDLLSFKLSTSLRKNKWDKECYKQICEEKLPFTFMQSNLKLFTTHHKTKFSLARIPFRHFSILIPSYFKIGHFILILKNYGFSYGKQP